MKPYLMGALFALASFAASAAQGGIVVQTVAEKEQVVTAADGTKSTRLVAAKPVVPGEEVVYTVTVTNEGKEVATGVAVTNPVPAHTSYVPGSAGGPGTEVTYSVDGGRTWAAADALTVRAADGTTRRATPADYTHIRWLLKNPLAPGAVAMARYRVIVN